MYQTISEEMLRFFATIVDFNNLVGEPVNRYRPNYKKLEKLRELFFLSVENEAMDLEKFIEYFKWVDDAVSIMIAQLIPLSSNKIDLLRNMVESHILERNKYWTKFPTLDVKPKEPVASLKAIEELKYNWKFGHAPVSAEQNTNQNISCLWWKQRADRTGALSSGDASLDSQKNSLLKITVTEVSGSETTLKTIGGTKYSGPYYYNRSLARPVDLVTHKSLKLKAGANPDSNKIHDFYKSVITWGSDDDFIYLDIDNEIKTPVCDDKVKPDETNKKAFTMKALTMKANQTTESDAFGKGKDNDLKYTDAKSTLLMPFSTYTSSVDSGYQATYASQFGLEFTNMHEDKYGPHAEIPLQGPFAEKHVGGMQHRHTKLNQGSDSQTTRAEGWHLQPFLNQATGVEYAVTEYFTNATTTATNDASILSVAGGSLNNDPSPYEYWRNGVGSDNKWDFLSGPTPSAGTGPASGKYAYCEVLPARVGQTFALVTPLIDMLDNDSTIRLYFKYHMHGLGIGNLRVQASTDPNFVNDVEDVWIRSGQQHVLDTDSFSAAVVDSDTSPSGTPGSGTQSLANFKNKRFYIRFFYTAGITHLGDCAIDHIQIYKSSAGGGPGWKQNSFKMLHPTFDNHHRPYATYTRGTLAKRPVNISNIQTTGSSPTVAGNYLNRYEYVNTVSPEVNDPWFVKNFHTLAADHKLRYSRGNISGNLGEVLPPMLALVTRNQSTHPEFTLPDRSYLTGTIKNKTRIRTRFSSPGGFETLSRGFLDPEHETYSANNAMTFRNLWPRNVHNTEMQAHCGQFGVSAHDTTTARVYGVPNLTAPQVGAITENDYEITGHAAKHKIHRNNLERVMYSSVDADSDFEHQAVVTASVYDNAFVTHMIPRTDNQTRWITGSLI